VAQKGPFKNGDARGQYQASMLGLLLSFLLLMPTCTYARTRANTYTHAYLTLISAGFVVLPPSRLMLQLKLLLLLESSTLTLVCDWSGELLMGG
jgi:hypothetical protein